MSSRIIDIMPVVAPDQQTLAREVSALLKSGWSVYGPVKLMRPLADLSTTVFHQMLVRWS